MSRGLEVPARPSLPVTLPILGGVLAGECVVLRMGWAPTPLPVIVAGTVLAAAAVGCGARPAVRLGALVGLALAAGVLAGLVAHWSLGRFADELGSSSVSTWTLEVASDPSLGDYGYRCRARATRPGSPSGFVWLSSGEEPHLGETLTCVGRFRPNGDDDWGRSNRAQGVAGTIRLVRLLGRRPARGPVGLLLGVRAHALEAMGAQASEEGALVAASVCGYRGGMDAEGLTDLFSACGVSHLVAVSGGHLVIVSGILSALLEACGLRPRMRGLLLIGVTGAFVLFCGAPVSATRSWLMVIVGLGAELLGRRGHSLSAVCVVGAAIALANPFTSGELGFLLSVSSVVGLCVLSPYASYALAVALPLTLPHRLARRSWGRRLARGMDALRETLAATLVAQVVTAPLTIPVFGELSLVAPLANLVLGPLFSPLIGAGMVAVPLCLLPGRVAVVAQLPLGVARGCGWLALALLRPLAHVPIASVTVTGWQVPLASCILVVALYLVWPRLRRGALLAGGTACACVMAAVLLRWRLFAPARIVVLDVGQGDAILVQDGGSAILVDTGPDATVASALARQHVLHLDAVVLTHLHADHVGGLDDLVGVVPCEGVLVAEGVGAHVEGDLAASVEELTGGEAGELRYGDRLGVGGFVLEVVSPVGEVTGEENADSLELLVTYVRGGDALTALLTGDAERDETGAALGRGDVGDIDLLKVGHHGSAVSLTEEEARELDPEVSVASAGEGNSYGHPTPACVEVLERVGSRFLCTMDVGDVEVRPGRGCVRVRYDGAHGS